MWLLLFPEAYCSLPPTLSVPITEVLGHSPAAGGIDSGPNHRGAFHIGPRVREEWTPEPPGNHVPWMLDAALITWP